MSRILFAKTYPYVPGKVDALVIVSINKVTLPEELVLLPPYPPANMLEGEHDFYNTIEVTPDEIPEGIESNEISPESFAALGTRNPNDPTPPRDEEVARSMSKEDVLKLPWSKNIMGKESEEDEDQD